MGAERKVIDADATIVATPTHHDILVWVTQYDDGPPMIHGTWKDEEQARVYDPRKRTSKGTGDRPRNVRAALMSIRVLAADLESLS